jgi:hypothetical protein
MNEDDFVFNFSELLASKQRQFEPKTGYGHRVAGFDIARFGNDKSACVCLHQLGALAWTTNHIEQWEHKDLDYTTGRILSIANQIMSNENIIDEEGLGAGPLDFITKGRERDDFIGFRNTAYSFEKNRFYGNKRTECAFKLKEWVSKGWINISDEGLIQELMTLKYRFTSDGRKILISKDEMRKLGIKSPNMADALLMAISLAGEAKEAQDRVYQRQPHHCKEENLFQLAGVR